MEINPICKIIERTVPVNTNRSQPCDFGVQIRFEGWENAQKTGLSFDTDRFEEMLKKDNQLRQKKKEERIAALNPLLVCASCHKEEISALLLPCHHAVTCDRCAEGEITHCPQCNMKIETVHRLDLLV